MMLAELMARTGATPRQVDSWGTQGLYVDDRRVIGSGMRRRYCETDVRRTLVALGLSPFMGNRSGGPMLLVPITLAAIAFADGTPDRFTWLDGAGAFYALGHAPDGVTLLRVDTDPDEPTP